MESKPAWKSIIRLKKVDSTNNYASNLLKKENPDEGCIVVADFQEKGRGQINNQWESEAGKNLLLSVILYPAFIKADKQFAISKCISLAILDFLKHYIDDVSIKWPNDIYYRNKKIAGILIENTILGQNIQHTVAGMGININQKTFSGQLPNPVSLAQILKKEFDLLELLKALSMHLSYWYNQLSNGFFNDVDQDYLKNLYLLNKLHDFKIGSGILRGKITGVSKEGCLTIQTQDGDLKLFSFKEIVF